MNKKIKVGLTILVGAYLLVGFGLGGAVGYFQPQDGETAVLLTYDSEGVGHETVLRPIEGENGQIWLLSGQWFRSWYNRALQNPEIELKNKDKLTSYRATALQDQKEVARVVQLRMEGVSRGSIYLQRALLLFAPVKILKLEVSE